MQIISIRGRIRRRTGYRCNYMLRSTPSDTQLLHYKHLFNRMSLNNRRTRYDLYLTGIIKVIINFNGRLLRLYLLLLTRHNIRVTLCRAICVILYRRFVFLWISQVYFHTLRDIYLAFSSIVSATTTVSTGRCPSWSHVRDAHHYISLDYVSAVHFATSGHSHVSYSFTSSITPRALTN